ncbi:PIG-L family deacetylase [Castellaniella sp. GW247-6E4]|uniref:PIG-L family deacetylase n=1 Tax=Castellaniella sp. GW247-6E4 TaxID=3140380 RepID=UPI003314AEA5
MLFWLVALLPAHAWADTDGTCRHQIRDLVFVAHMDDDLLFMNPDLADTLRGGGCLQLVYLTASDRGEGAPYMLGRERGIQAAYAQAAGVRDEWIEDTLRLEGRRLARYTLADDPRIRLVQMRIQDPWLGKGGWGSLTPLSRAESDPRAEAESIGPWVERYVRAGLVTTLAALIRDYAPTTIRTMDATIATPYTELCWRCAGNDHPDHIAGARLVREAMAQTPGTYAEVGYLNYPTQERPGNLDPVQTAAKTAVFLTYMRHDYRYCRAPARCDRPAGPEAAWVSRIYYVSNRNTPATLLARPGGPVLLTVDEHANVVSLRADGMAQAISPQARSADPAAVFQPSARGAGILVRSPDGRVLTTRIGAVGGPAPWQPIDGARLTRPPTLTAGASPWALGMGYDGRLQLSRWDTERLRWAAWRDMPPLPKARAEAAIAERAGRGVLILATDEAGRLWCASVGEAFPDDDPVRWRHVPGILSSGGLALLQNAAGRMEAYLRAQHNGHMLRMTQRRGRAGCTGWGTPEDLGLTYQGRPAILLGPAGRMIVAARERDAGPLWLIQDGRARRLPGAPVSDPTLALIDGDLHITTRQAGPAQDYLVLSRHLGVWRGDIIRAPRPPALPPLRPPPTLKTSMPTG